jgi:uncharacterized protein
MIRWLSVEVPDPFGLIWSSDNPLVPILALPALLFTAILIAPGLYLGFRSRSTLRAASRKGAMPSASGVTGAAAASAVLMARGATDVAVLPSDHWPGDRFEPRLRQLHLSRPVYDGRSLFAIGLAAFEAGRAGDPRSWMRDLLVLALLLARETACLLIVAAVVARYYKLVLLGVTGYSGIALSALILLPIEWHYARGALAALAETAGLPPDELDVIREVIAAARWKIFLPLLPGRDPFGESTPLLERSGRRRRWRAALQGPVTDPDDRPTAR